MNIIKYFFCLIKGRPQTDSYILQLPLELLLKILAHLPPYSQLLVYQTCRSLRAITHQYFLEKIHLWSKREYVLLYLTHLSRSRPDQWVCAPCSQLHQASAYDTPACRPFSFPECEKKRKFINRSCGEFRRFIYHEYHVEHRHVQLALKYARLNDPKWKHQGHLQRLTTPYHYTFYSPLDVDIGISGRYSAYPKVVNGRYLLFAIWTYREARTKVLQNSIISLLLCPHLHNYRGISRHNEFFTQSRYRPFSTERMETFDACPFCRTDYYVQTSPERVIVCAWQDFGAEGTILDLDWRSIVLGGQGVYHQPGSVRELYGEHEYEGEIY